MYITSTLDGPLICTHSKTCNSVDTTPADPTTTSTNDKVNTPQPLTEDQKDTFRLMQRTDPFCKCISKGLLCDKTPSPEVDTFRYMKGHICKHEMYSNQRFLTLVIPKSWCCTVLVDAHDKLKTPRSQQNLSSC